MKKLILTYAGVFLLTALFVTPQATAQFTTNGDAELVWSLDPREHPDLFPRGPAFGARSVFTGMDFDGDGNKEILFTTDETLAPGGPDPGFLDVFLYENTGDNTYEYVWSWTEPNASNSLPAIAWGDMDGDGLQEI
ncbi:MAG: VCBS repeat-containing protein, partial [Rhodothermales bacterium]